ncbi:MAG: hypothetical protein AAFU85_32675, partial [Planctomycetota bacterium]
MQRDSLIHGIEAPKDVISGRFSRIHRLMDYTQVEPSIDLSSTAPHEEIQFTLVEGLKRFVATTLLMTTFTTSLIAGLGTCLYVSLWVGGRIAGPATAVEVFFNVLYGWGIVWFGIAFLCLPISLIMCLLGRSRTMSVEGDEFIHRAGWRDEKLGLSGCRFVITNGWAWDGRGCYFGAKLPGLVLVQEKRSVGAGFTKETAIHWRQYFQSLGVKERKPWPMLQMIVFLPAGAFIGGMLGLAMQKLMPPLGGPPVQAGVLVFIGAIDGLIAMLYFLTIRRSHGKVGRTQAAFIIMMAFAVFPVKWGGFFWQILVANALIGATIGWFFYSHSDVDANEFGEHSPDPLAKPVIYFRRV